MSDFTCQDCHKPCENAAQLARHRAMKHGNFWTRESVVTALQRIYIAGANMSPTAMQGENNGLFIASRRHYGTYREALKAAGIDADEFFSKRGNGKHAAVAPVNASGSGGVPAWVKRLRSRQV